MIISPISNTSMSPDTGKTNLFSLVKKFYPNCNPEYFNNPPNIFDEKYIFGLNRKYAFLKEEYFTKKNISDIEIKKLYSEDKSNFIKLEPSEVNSIIKSWSTVIQNKRPIGQFSVDTLFSPELHSLLELDRIGSIIFPKENNDFLHIVVIYRKDSKHGETYANRFIELYNMKREIMDKIQGPQHIKVRDSEKIIAEEMGALLYYTESSINDYMQKLNEM